MELDSTGWPELPPLGLKIRFCGGTVLLQCLGICTIISAEHVRNAAGKPGGRVGLRLDDGKLVSVRLSDVRNYAFVEETTTERHTPVAGEIIRHEFGKESDGGQ